MSSIACITGASSGFGLASARRFIHEGWKVIALARREDRLQSLQDEYGKEKLCAIALDVRDHEAVQKLPGQLPEEFSAPVVLVNNAGLALGLEKAHEAHWEDWETMVATNIRGLLSVTRAFLPMMVEQGRGHIINIGSIAGNWPYPGGNVYGATKAFVRQFSLNLRADLIGTPVRVTNIEPGLAETEFSVVRFKGRKEQAGKVYQGTEPLTGKDIAESVFWVASQPAHVNINSIEIMPTCQAWSSLAVAREGESD